MSGLPIEPSCSEYSLAIPTTLAWIEAFAIGRRGFEAATSWAVSTFVVAATNASAAAAAKNATPALKRRYATIRFGLVRAVFMVWVRGRGIWFLWREAARFWHPWSRNNFTLPQKKIGNPSATDIQVAKKSANCGFCPTRNSHESDDSISSSGKTERAAAADATALS